MISTFSWVSFDLIVAPKSKENVTRRWEVSVDGEEKKRAFKGPNFNDCANNTRHKLSSPTRLKKYDAIAVGRVG